MHFKISSLIVVFTAHLTVTFAAEEGSTCLTPTGESANCVTIDSCKVIKKAIEYLEKDALEFARKSQCGYKNGPLVCCGSVGRFPVASTTIANSVHLSTVAPFNNSVVITPIDDIHLPDESLCGIQSKGDRMQVASTSSDEYPWTVALKYEKANGNVRSYSFLCAGTLINRRYVVTAAECFNIATYTLKTVRLGEWKFSTDEDCDGDSDEENCANPIFEVQIEKVVAHPFYNKKTGNNNIGLILLSEKVNYSAFIRPICLPPQDFPVLEEGNTIVLSGWGFTQNGTLSDTKLKKQLLVKNDEACASIVPESIRKVTDRVCVDLHDYVGDTGGSIMRLYYKTADLEDEQWYIEGVVINFSQFQQKGAPIFYVRLAKYTSWILNNLEHS